jgi:YpzG-like protein
MSHKKRQKFSDDAHSSLFQSTWTRPKHAKAQVNGQTMQTQSLIILANETKKRQF